MSGWLSTRARLASVEAGSFFQPFQLHLQASDLLVQFGFQLLELTLLPGIVLLSALYNHSSLMSVVLFMRILGFSYLMYKLVDLYIRPDNIVPIVRLCVTIAMFQLPVILLQRWG